MFFCNFSQGESKNFLASDIQYIKIEVLKMDVSFKKSNSKEIQFDGEGSFSMRLRNGVLEIKDSDYDSKSSWKFFSKSSKKVPTLKIKGPSKQVSIFGAFVRADFEKWDSPVFISSHVSEISGTKNSSLWNVFSKKSKINFSDHKGDFNFKGFSLVAKLKNFSETKSQFDFNDGSLKLTKGSGDIFFTTDKAKVSIKDFRGNLVGATRSGFIHVTMRVDQKVEVSSKESEMHFHFKKTGSRFLAYAEKGKIYAPAHMHKEYSGKSLKVTGKMQGPGQGKISLKTDTGNIHVY